MDVYIVQENNQTNPKTAQTAKDDDVVPESFTYSKQQLWKRIIRPGDDGSFFLAQVQVL